MRIVLIVAIVWFALVTTSILTDCIWFVIAGVGVLGFLLGYLISIKKAWKHPIAVSLIAGLVVALVLALFAQVIWLYS